MAKRLLFYGMGLLLIGAAGFGLAYELSARATVAAYIQRGHARNEAEVFRALYADYREADAYFAAYQPRSPAQVYAERGRP
jgi:hypothetical protein